MLHELQIFQRNDILLALGCRVGRIGLSGLIFKI
jgi:hypothetical protein